ncbi:MAG: coproporphyrinogen dehydrogenase HemZ [Firmicutes bacterium]|nr:coproporphyrinogen dehydrogenase HemZ [Bacillota bacterium]
MGDVNAFYMEGKDFSESYLYELSMLAREFFPMAEIAKEPVDVNLYCEGRTWRLVAGEEVQEHICPQDSVFAGIGGDAGKNSLKAGLYELLSRWTGRQVPWGILTGVRPTKIAYSALEQGRNRGELQKQLTEAFHLRGDKAELMVQVADAERQLLEDHRGTDLDLYVGIPFCPSKCSYCSFVSYDFHTLGDTMERYTQALVQEIRACGAFKKERRLQSFYMGGGTPTSLTPDQLDRVLGAIQEAFGFENMREATVEAGRPDTITRERLGVLKKYGIDRISVNPQTMNEETLVRIGRRHTVEDTRRAFALARDMGFTNINMDFIMGLPGEGLKEAAYSMEEVVKMAPDSLTVHTLAVKRSSRLNQEGMGESVLDSQDIEAMIAISAEAAARLGMKPYYMYRQKNMAGNFENVGYSLPGKECLYNIEIMEERQSILGMGAGAVSKFYEPEMNRLERLPNVKNVEEYIRRIDEMLERKKRRFDA